MTDAVKLLSDDEVSKLLVLSQQNTGPSFGYTHDLCKAIDALCATVRALRESETFWQERTRARTTEVERLQAQLAQVTQERQLCLQVQKRGIHSSATCPCVIAMERSNHESH